MKAYGNLKREFAFMKKTKQLAVLFPVNHRRCSGQSNYLFNLDGSNLDVFKRECSFFFFFAQANSVQYKILLGVNHVQKFISYRA